MRGMTEKVQEMIKDYASDQRHKLILMNDEVNTFDHVIRSLIRVVNHSPEQAEQCAYITHYKGSCQIKSGSKEELMPIYRSLIDLDLDLVLR